MRRHWTSSILLELWLAPGLGAQEIGPAHRSLVIVGGAMRDETILRRFIVLAETEFPVDASLPNWIAAHLRREVTGSERYELFSLARRCRAKRPDLPQPCISLGS